MNPASFKDRAWPITAYTAYLPKPFYAYGSPGYALNLFNLERDLNFGTLNRTAKSSTPATCSTPTGRRATI